MASTYTNLLYHLVFSTKDRKPFIKDEYREDLYSYIGGIIRGEGGVQLEIGGTADHVHILMKAKPTMSVSDWLRCIKTNPSKWMNERKSKGVTFAWQDGYAAFTVSESQAPTLRRYIKNQESHHRRRTFKDEFRALLERHGIEYDELYLWR